jgi:hypothetical protein
MHLDKRLALWQEACAEFFPPSSNIDDGQAGEESKQDGGETDSTNFREPIVDQMRAQKE